ncbi:hypothetical protein [Croceicoccus sp. Ery15]|uniref:hypothetical protein n=1 Tax=Croceicoccus sp. Ery15 TaxID=1703338 RepID=UPI001E30160C|nr:hypothetical protein [Croceicoccus sp. Ery15]
MRKARVVLRGGLALSALVALAACGSQGGRPGGDRYGRMLQPVAQPGQIVAAEIAFGQRAREKGQWSAFREYATKDAIMFVPQVVNAQQWLKGRTDPAETLRWQPHEIWSSCDGSLSVSFGAWQGADGSTGWFTTAWQRQDDGSYRWTMDQGAPAAQPVAAPDIIATHTATCAARGGPPAGPPSAPQPPAPQPPAHSDAPYGISRDGTLRWDIAVADDCARTIAIRMKDGDEWGDPVFSRDVAAPGGASCAA